MGTRTRRLHRFDRYDRPTDLAPWHAMALASIVGPGEEYVLGIDCADYWLFGRWGTKLVLTDERVVAFAADPAGPMKRSHRLEEIAEVAYDRGLVAAELRFLGADFLETYPVPRRLGREFADAVRSRLD
jgi:hypothetical protein